MYIPTDYFFQQFRPFAGQHRYKAMGEIQKRAERYFSDEEKKSRETELRETVAKAKANIDANTDGGATRTLNDALKTAENKLAEFLGQKEEWIRIRRDGGHWLVLVYDSGKCSFDFCACISHQTCLRQAA